MQFKRCFPCGRGETERIIEIPWALSRYNGGQRVLEVGCSFADENPAYVQGLKELNIPELHGIDISSVEAPDFIKKTADIRDSGYESSFFDFILCISTIEHVGMDNTKHYKPVAEISSTSPDPATPPDLKAMAEMFRILRPGGKLIVTAPFGKAVNYGWFQHYDMAGIERLFSSVSPANVISEYFMYSAEGWMPCTPGDLAQTIYRSNSAPAAAGLACFEVTK